MKKLLTYCSAILLFINVSNVFAGQVNGGEITWECTNDGRYVFYMNIYKDCIGVQLGPQDVFISIVGTPLPTNGVTNIRMKFDHATYNAANQGLMGQHCSSSYSSNPNCGDANVYRFYPYRSDTISLQGAIPTSGWTFAYGLIGTSAHNFSNIADAGSLILEAIMYGKSGVNADSCFFSSPKFAQIPLPNYYKGGMRSMDLSAEAKGALYLNYSNALIKRSINPSPTYATYRSGYNKDNPTPSDSLNSRNANYNLNAESGIATFAVYDSTSRVYYIQTNTQIDLFDDTTKLATVFRLVPIYLRPQDTLPSGSINHAPIIASPVINGVATDSFSVVSGSAVSFQLNYSDLDNNGVGNGMQQITLVPSGSQFSRDLRISTNCINANDTSCATFNNNPTFDANLRPGALAYKFLRSGVLSFNWQTDCNHLGTGGGAKTHYFNFKAFDDHCPVPSTTYKTIAITVLPSSNNCNLITGIAKQSLLEKETLYPNPTTGQINLSLNSEVREATIQIRNIQGQLIQQEYFQNQSSLNFNIDGEAGVYFISLTDEKGERANFKVVKR